jgi:hypothetical protein
LKSSSIRNPQSAIRNQMRLAHFTLLPPSKSGIADYNSEPLPYLAKGGEPAWIRRTGEEVTIRLRVEADDDCPEPMFAVDAHRFDGVFVGGVNTPDLKSAPLLLRSLHTGRGALKE